MTVEQEIAAVNAARKFLEREALDLEIGRGAAEILAHYPNATQVEHLYGTLGKVAGLEEALRAGRDRIALEAEERKKAEAARDHAQQIVREHMGEHVRLLARVHRLEEAAAKGFPVTDAEIYAFMASYTPTPFDRAMSDRVWSGVSKAIDERERAHRRVVERWFLEELLHAIRWTDAQIMDLVAVLRRPGRLGMPVDDAGFAAFAEMAAREAIDETWRRAGLEPKP